jgi:hypothetical protein
MVRDYLRGAEDLRADDFTGADGLAGYCYVATEVLYHLLQRDAGVDSADSTTRRNVVGDEFRPYCVTVHTSHHSRDVPVRVHHYYLMDEESGEVLDATADQFEEPPAYERGRPVPEPSEPSPRAQTVLDALDV